MIVVIGDAMVDRDLIHTSTGRFTPDGGRPIVTAERTVERPGGAAAVAEMVFALGEPCRLFHLPGKPSVKSRQIVDGRTIFRVDDDNRRQLSPAEADLVLHRLEADPPSIILVADYGKGMVTRGLWRELRAFSRSTGIRLVVDPARGRPFEFYTGAWAICPNRLEWLAEAKRAYNSEDPCLRFCLKVDVDGMEVYEQGLKAQLPSLARRPLVDPCGAGDMVLAALGVSLSRGQSWLDACRFANTCAAVKCGKVGAVPVSMAEIAAFVRDPHGASRGKW